MFRGFPRALEWPLWEIVGWMRWNFWFGLEVSYVSNLCSSFCSNFLDLLAANPNGLELGLVK